MPNAQLQSWSIPSKATIGQALTLHVGLINTGDAGYIEPELEVQDYIAGQWLNRRYIYATPQYKWAESGLGGEWIYVDFPIPFTMPNVEAVAFFIYAYAWINNAWQMTVNAAGPFIMQAETPVDVVPHPADIVSIDAPSSASAGAQVPVDVSVKNVGSLSHYFGITGVYNDTLLTWLSAGQEVGPGQTVFFTSSFPMPSANVRVTIYMYHWDTAGWVFDDTGYADIALAVAEIALTATVTVTNRSTRLGVPSPALLFTEISALVGETEIGSLSEQHNFAAGEPYSIPFTFTIQAADFGKSGQVLVAVLDPSGRQIASGAKSFYT